MPTVFSRRDFAQYAGTRPLIAGIALCALALCVGGCQSKPPDQTTQNIDTFQHASQQLTDARAQVGKTLEALDDYTKRPGPDTHDAFVSQIGELQRQADQAKSTAAAMHDQGDAYFATWDAELASMSNANLRNESADQKSDTQQAFRQIAGKSSDVRAAYDKFMDDLNNLRTYFERDKSASGVAAASSQIARTQADGTELQRQLDQQSANLTRVKSIFTTMKQG